MISEINTIYRRWCEGQADSCGDVPPRKRSPDFHRYHFSRPGANLAGLLMPGTKLLTPPIDLLAER